MLKALESFLLNLAVAAVIALGLMITASVFSRAIFNVALPDTIVIVRELMVAAIVLPLAAATLARSHVAVEFLANRLPPRAQAWLAVFGSIVGLFALMPLIYAGGREFAHNFTSGGFFYGDLELPKWPGRLIFLIGISLCWLRLLVLVVQDIRAVRAGDYSFADTHAEGLD
ncbi:TRAP transporter small permease [Phaeobacter gallaeciensis]|jgi:TRAP-type C4-dicarboxylate transport system permease small subunit|nr:TRAP transporter small permease [Phaeobacter gallaeciensis]MDE4302362.1 TRAP transporter small permease [Phaeobacter gallaeciensis]MDE4306660.1 TRAP transporter small permease [Phaeobacter gallaeciensis]MDE4311221.1 TRAP transporter small permease [Phaeobacter gallaeciensis]MDE4315684.1 TRAP transporter small permease [Phaeobacter gallaeciensis]MDE4320148.1 TRAP transporter small permease [Phaeobacter gallaeciensis]